MNDLAKKWPLTAGLRERDAEQGREEYRGKKTDAVEFCNFCATLYYLIYTVVSHVCNNCIVLYEIHIVMQRVATALLAHAHTHLSCSVIDVDDECLLI